MQQDSFTLLIDDDVISNFINQRLIKKRNPLANIKIALNGEEGLKIIQEEFTRNNVMPQIIFLDVNMPVMNGMEFIIALRNYNFSGQNLPPIVMLTTSTNPKDLDELDKLGMNFLINKPLTDAKLLKAMESFENI